MGLCGGTFEERKLELIGGKGRRTDGEMAICFRVWHNRTLKVDLPIKDTFNVLAFARK